MLHGVRTVNNLSLPIQTIDIDELAKEWPYIKNVPLNSMRDAAPMLLIGQDNWSLTIPRSYIQRRWNDPVLTKAWLGWIIHGQVSCEKHKRKNHCSTLICSNLMCSHSEECHNDEDLYNIVKRSYEIEEVGLNLKGLQSEGEILAKNILENTTRRISPNQWKTGLLWKNGHILLPESKENALKRLKFVQKRMKYDEEFAEAYKTKIKDYISKGYARKLREEEIDESYERNWYLPHFAVVNPNKPKKIR